MGARRWSNFVCPSCEARYGAPMVCGCGTRAKEVEVMPVSDCAVLASEDTTEQGESPQDQWARESDEHMLAIESGTASTSPSGGSGAPLPEAVREYRVNAYDGIFGPFPDRQAALTELGEHQADWDDNGGPRPPDLESRVIGPWEPGAGLPEEEKCEPHTPDPRCGLCHKFGDHCPHHGTGKKPLPEPWPSFVVQRFERDDPIRPHRYIVLDGTQSTDFSNCHRYVPAPLPEAPGCGGGGFSTVAVRSFPGIDGDWVALDEARSAYRALEEKLEYAEISWRGRWDEADKLRQRIEELGPEPESVDGEEWPPVLVIKDRTAGPESGWILAAPGDERYPDGGLREPHHRYRTYVPAEQSHTEEGSDAS